MNFKTILLASAAVMFAGAASAEDFTGSLYLPTKGNFLSNTQFAYDRGKTEREFGEIANEGLYLRETLTYGITDNFSVYGFIGNEFDWKGFTDQSLNNDHNFDYSLGAKYNWRAGKWIGQVGAGYYTYDPESFYGHSTDENWYKELNGNVQLGYEVCEGLTPYTSFTGYGNIDDADRDIEFQWFGGVHKSWEKYALDAGIRYDFATDGENENTWYAVAEADYFVTDKVAVGVFGDYYLGGDHNDVIDYEYTAGLTVKALF